MALLRITEPGQTPPPHQAKYAAGIDLGTTNSLVATVRNGQAQTLPDAQGNEILPSVVHYQQNSTTVGLKAVDAQITDPKNTFFSIKRLLSKKIHDIDQSQYPYPLKENHAGHLVMPSAQGDMNPVQVSADIIRTLVQRAEKTLANRLQGVVITVPAHFDDSQRQATKDAAKLAGIPVLRLLNEPTAAAIAYGLNTQQDNLIAVYDLGGGTFDISILRLRQGVFEVLATGGDTALGGDDLDASIIEWLKTQLPCTKTNDAHQQAKLKILARGVKHQLSQQQQAEISFQGRAVILSRDGLNSLLEPWIKKTLQTCQRTIRDAKIALSDIKQVVLVGGSTRDPYIRQRVNEFFQQQPLCNIDPDKVVAIGAAIQADILIGNPQKHEMLLLDVVPLSLGVETMGGLSEKIIQRNTTIPISRAQDFTTFKDGQTAMSIHVVQGEREQVEHCRSLAKFTLRGIPPMSAGIAQIRITFQIDADGLLCVSAMEKSTRTQASIEVQSSYGLSEQEMNNMLVGSQQHAQEDIAQRMLIEQRIEAQQRLLALEKGLQEDGQTLLSEQELTDIRHACEKTKQALSQNDVQYLKQCIEQLDQASEPFAMRRMEYSIKQALTGKDVNKV